MAATSARDGADASEPWWRRKRPRRPPPPPEADAEAVKMEVLELLAAFPVLPRLVVFDLDYTLWPFQWAGFKSGKCHPHVHKRKDKGVEMAIASRASRRGVAKTFLEILGIHSMFGEQEIFYTWSPKGDHFQNIHRKTGVPYQSMLFFDDEVRNIIAVSSLYPMSHASKLGVSCVCVEKGVTFEKLRMGLGNFAKSSAAPKAEQTQMGLRSFFKTSAAPKPHETEG
ncbi:hypothetical protein PR202_gb27345 [Eleusine coracana subsp. coracana]|uniref:Magnesium-dependent phosphatase 1 n=1 Tax=Eleusine coracana subsp. coracana TaxID=191504 RepID=A0AAV5FU96_ELECO|nr:hypothetical protein PR202_gb27345 [Eleusine coracana subsp. coracana]